MARITKHVHPVTNLKMAANWIWTRGRKVLILFILAVLIIFLAHMTPPVLIHAQQVHLAPSDQSDQP
jgi:hypothetical protein